MSDASEWVEVSGATEPRGRLLPLLLVLALVLAIAALGYVGVTLGTKAVSFVGGFAVHTVHERTSPDGASALVIDTHDEGALGGSTTVTLRPASGSGRSSALYDGDWLPDSAVRWQDGRTVSLAGELQTPFVAHAVATGSPATSGVPLDAAGYALNTVAPGERVVLLSGLSLVLPGGASAQLATRWTAAGSAPWQRLASSPMAGRLVETYRSPADVPAAALSGRVVARWAHRHVVVRWDASRQSLSLLTRLPGRMTGLITCATSAP